MSALRKYGFFAEPRWFTGSVIVFQYCGQKGPINAVKAGGVSVDSLLSIQYTCLADALTTAPELYCAEISCGEPCMGVGEDVFEKDIRILEKALVDIPLMDVIFLLAGNVYLDLDS